MSETFWMTVVLLGSVVVTVLILAIGTLVHDHMNRSSDRDYRDELDTHGEGG